jgi:hypothetical protein
MNGWGVHHIGAFYASRLLSMLEAEDEYARRSGAHWEALAYDMAAEALKRVKKFTPEMWRFSP